MPQVDQERAAALSTYHSRFFTLGGGKVVDLRAFAGTALDFPISELRGVVSETRERPRFQIISPVEVDDFPTPLGVIRRNREYLARELEQEHGINNLTAIGIALDIADGEIVTITEVLHPQDGLHTGILTPKPQRTPSQTAIYILRVAQGR